MRKDKSLQMLRQAAAGCRECPLGFHATQTAWGEGPIGARLMLVGPAGQLLDRAFEALGWPRDKLYITNAVKHFKFEVRGKRRMHKTPAQREAAACLHWLESEIEQIDPSAIVALGSTAARSLMGRPVAVMAQRGQWLEREDGRRVLITLHPSALLRLVADREEAYEQWLADLRHASAVARKSTDPE